jgi:hypothetical protein
METLISRLYTFCFLGIPALLAVTHLLVYRELRNIKTELYNVRQVGALYLLIQTRSKDETKTDANNAHKVEPAENVPTAPLQ